MIDGYGVHAAGAYAPPDRITAEEIADAWGRFEASGIDTTAVPAADEDALTMGWEAARRALSAGGTDAAALDFLAFATTTPPVEEEDLTARLASFLGVEGAATHALGGSTRAGTRALVAALDAAPERGLVVAADCPQGEPDDAHEHAAGAGAAAFLVGHHAPAAVADRAETTTPFPGTRFRERGDDRVRGIDVTSYDRRSFREVTTAAADAVDAGTPDAAAVQAPDGKLPYRVADALGTDAETIAVHETVSELGDTAAASVPLSLALALALGDGPGRVLAVGYGSGASADALVIDADDPVPAEADLDAEGEELSYAAYLRRRGEVTSGEPTGGGAYVSVPSWQRSLPQRHRMIAGRCPDCDAIAFPPEGACPDCGSLADFEDERLPREGEVEAVTRISRGGAPPEFAEQQARGGDFGVAVVRFGETSVPAQVVRGDPDVGDPVETIIRRVYTQEGVTRYGFKARGVE
jgi:hydroxymethylglutaryl-CoA synthase